MSETLQQKIVRVVSGWNGKAGCVTINRNKMREIYDALKKVFDT